MRLSGDAGWSALVAAFATAWGACPDGGSVAIRAHLDEVTARLAAARGRDPVVTARASELRPVAALLGAALEAGAGGAASGLARALAPVAARLTWEWGYAKMPEALARSYAYCEILGPRGPVRDDHLILGFVLFAPGTFYPPHAHEGIAESYLTVAGHWAQDDAGVGGAGTLVFNAPGRRHAITTGRESPCLLAWAWTGDSARLAAPGMVLD